MGSRKLAAGALSLGLLLSLTACGGDEGNDQGVPQEQTQTDEESGLEVATETYSELESETEFEGTSEEIDQHLSLTIPDGWTMLSGDIPGLDIYILMVVPEDLERDELEPDAATPDYAYLTVMDIGKTRNGAERYSKAIMESDAENTDFYSDLAELEPVEVGETVFYGYEGTFTKQGIVTPFQSWHADANGTTYVIDIHGDVDGVMPQVLTDAFHSIRFGPAQR